MRIRVREVEGGEMKGSGRVSRSFGLTVRIAIVVNLVASICAGNSICWRFPDYSRLSTLSALVNELYTYLPSFRNNGCFVSSVYGLRPKCSRRND